MTKRSLEYALKLEAKRGGAPSAKHSEAEPPSAPHLVKGRMGEELAAGYLTAQGITIIERNVRIGRCEIDIIAKEGDELVFAEVRTRGENRLMSPEESVGPRKLSNLIFAGRAWTEERNYNGFWRIDLVSVILAEGREPRIEHLRGITEPII
ncbi:YraN family protein [Cloacibacillus sp.]|uniref:YraN family protein n=1 Tax=Cloacibacillus sp. TaxID=2049023 RepID=UPI0025C10635|nr:YraN family protein [Cloacibacillus sp.]MCC8058652.1 YraN family protein [Cloacibacillus sp.]MCC8177763.1 YraN family protein [Cloacibacillus sp.]